MPDQDIVDRSLKQPWKRCYRLVKGGHPPEVVAESLSKSLAAELRRGRGILGLEEVWTATLEAHGRPDGVKSVAAKCRTLEQRFQQQSRVKLLGRSAQRNLAQIEAGRALPGPVPIIEDFLRESLRHEFFAKVTHRLVGKVFTDVAEARCYEAQIWSRLEPQLKILANRLATDPTAEKLRAPRTQVRRRTTAELIDMPVGIGGV